MSLAELFYTRQLVRRLARRADQRRWRRPRQRPFLLEPLEGRVLLSSDPSLLVPLVAPVISTFEPPTTEIEPGVAATAEAEPVNVDAFVTVTFEAATFDDTTETFLEPVVIENVSDQTLADPLRIVLTDIQGPAKGKGRGPRIQLANADGTTPAGDPYVEIALDGGALAPGATVRGVLAFTHNPRIFTFQTDVLAVLPPADETPPTIAAALLNDTGADDEDGATSDPRIAGTIEDESAIAVFRVGLDGMAESSFVDVLDLLQPDGSFTLTADRLAAINGGSLPDGQHTVHLRVEDAAGNAADIVDVTLELDTAAPTVGQPDLDPASDSGADPADDNTRDGTPTVIVGAENGATVRLLLDGVQVAQGPAAGGTVAFTIGPLVDGTYTLSATAEDLAGNIGGPGATLTLIIDTVAPAPPVFDLDGPSDTAPAGDQATTLATVTLQGQTSASAAVTLLETGATTVADAAGGFVFPGVSLIVDANSFTTRATDRAGNASDSTRVIVRLEPPGQDEDPPVIGVALANDTGASAIDGTTSDPSVTGTVTDASPITAFRAGLDAMTVQQFADVLAALGAGGAFTLDGSALAQVNGGPLGQGSHTLHLLAEDGEGNVSSIVDLVFTLDTLAPAQPVFDLAAAFDTLPVGDQQTTFAAVTLEGTTEASAAVTLLETAATTIAGAGGAFSFTGVALVLGANSFTTRATDLAGNQTDFTRTITRLPAGEDVTPPAIVAALANDTGADADDGFTMDPTIQGTVVDESAIVTFRARLDEAADFVDVLASVGAGGAFTLDAAALATINGGPVANGAHTLHLQAEDSQGNASPIVDVTFSLDRVAPALPVFDLGLVFDSAPLGDQQTTVATVTLDGQTEAHVTVSLIETAAITEASGTGTFSFSGVALVLGANSFTTRATDLAGNQSDFTRTITRLASDPDLAPPLITASLVSDTGTNGADGVTSDPAIHGTVADVSAVAAFKAGLDGALPETDILSALTGAAFTLDAAAMAALAGGSLAEGPHILHLVAEDSAGHVSGIFDLAFTLDTTAPTLVVTTPTTGVIITPGAHLVGTASDTGSGVDQVTYRFDSETVHAVAVGGGAAFDTTLAMAGLGEGDHSLTVRAADLAGNVVTTVIPLAIDGLPFTLTAHTPLDGDDGVVTAVRPRIVFSEPVNPASLTGSTFFATAAGESLAASIVVDPGGLFARLFFADPLPGGAAVTVTVVGAGIHDLDDGGAVDADGDGTPGGTLTFSFTTVSTVALPGTTLSGRLADTGPDMIPLTADDTLPGPDATLGTDDDVILLPVVGAHVLVRGLEGDFVVTGADGRFHFDEVPAGTVALALQGVHAAAPSGFTFPELNADLDVTAGVANDIGTIYMPRLAAAAIQTVNTSGTTLLTLAPGAAPGLTDEQRQQFTLEIAPGGLLGPDGLPVASADVLMSVVPGATLTPFLPATTPEPMLAFTTQLRGATDLASPLKMTFPNLAAAPVGTQFVVMSFDPATGKLVQDGTAVAVASPASATLAAASEFEQIGDLIIWDPGDKGGLVACFHIVLPGGGIGSNGPPERNEPVNEETPPEIDLRFLVSGQTDKIEFTFTAPAESDSTKVVEVSIGNSFFDDFYANVGDNRIRTETITLRPGDRDVTRSATLRALQDLLARVNNGRPLDDDRLYGSQITVVETLTLADGSTFRSSKIVLPYLYMDFSDEDATDDTLRFRDTVFEGGVTNQRTVHLVTAGAPTPTFVFEGPAEADYSGNTQALFFNPTQAGARSAIMRIRVDVAGQTVTSEVGAPLRGAGTARTIIYLNHADFITMATSSHVNLTTAKAEELYTGTKEQMLAMYSQLGVDINELLVFSDASSGPGPYIQMIWSFADTEIDDKNHNDCADPGEFNDRNGNGEVEEGEFTDLNNNHTVDFDDYGGLSPIDTNNIARERLLTKRFTLGKAQQVFVMDTFFNPIVDQQSQIFMDTLMNLSGNRPAPIMMGNTVVHEQGHTLGLIHSDHMGVADLDVMHAFAKLNAIFSDANRYAILMALNGSPSTDNVFLSTIPAYLRGFQNPDPSACSIVLPEGEFGDGGPSLSLLVPSSNASLFDTIDFGTVAADGLGGAVVTINALAQNTGGTALVIGGVSIAGAGFTVSGLAGAVIAPETSVPITLTFDPASLGDLEAMLAVETNSTVFPADPAGVLHFTLKGRGLDPDPVLTLEVANGNNNLGGVELGASQTSGGLLIVTNTGSADLVFTPTTPDGGDFDLGAFEGVAQTLAFGESLAIPVTFAPSALGLRPGVVTLASNDPERTTVTQAVVGTGIPAGGIGVDDFDWGDDFVRVASDGDVTRLVSSPAGLFQVILGPRSPYDIIVFDPVSGLVAASTGSTGDSGTFVGVTSPLAFRASVAPDSDGDGLPDDVEDAIGTNAGSVDTDDDTVSDFAEIAAGLDPLDGVATPSGIVGALSLSGEAWDVAVAGTRAFVATGGHGLAAVDISDPEQPVLIGTRDLGGFAVSVSVDEIRGLAAVASNLVDPGLNIIDVSDPAHMAVLRTVALPDGASQVEVLDGVAYVASGSAVRSIDLTSGDILQTLDLGGGALTGLAREGRTLFAMDAAGVLTAIDISGFQSTVRDSLGVAHGGGAVFVGGGIAYLGNVNGFRGGFATVDVSNPDDLVLISGSDVASGFRPDRGVAADGSGLALVIGSVPDPNQIGLTIDVVDVADVSDPAATDSYVRRVELPQFPLGITLASGVAFIADGSADLLVVGYRTPDVAGEAPLVSIDTLTPDVAPGTPGIQVVEGTPIHLVIDASDDAFVRGVEVLVNGAPVASDPSFPYEALISAGAPGALSIQARATDGGGTTALSNVLALEVVADTFAPTILSVDPADGATLPEGLQKVKVRFSEALDAASVTTTTFRVLDGNGQTVTPSGLQLSSENRVVQLEFAGLEADDYQVVISGPLVTDVAGNPLAAGDVVSSFTLTGDAIEWINPAGGFWDVAANWEGGVLPGPTDNVLIDVPGDVVITHRTGTTVINRLISRESLAITGGVLDVTTTMEVDGALTIGNGATLAHATVLPGTSVVPTVTSFAIFDGVTLATDLVVSVLQSLQVKNGLTLNEARVTLAGADLFFDGAQTLGGSGEVFFSNVSAQNQISASGGPLTIGENILVHGDQGGTLQAFSDGLLVLGTIQADGPGQTIVIDGDWINGGRLIGGAGILELDGTFTIEGKGIFDATKGPVSLTGILDNSGKTLALDAFTGPLTIDGGRIKGGTLTFAGGVQPNIVAAITLEGVTLASDLDLDGLREIDVQGGLTLNNATIELIDSTDAFFGPRLVFQGTQTLGGTGQVVFTGPGDDTDFNTSSGSTLTIGSGITIGGTAPGAGFLGTFINQGVVAFETAGQFIDVFGSFANQGTLRVLNGARITYQNLSNAGTLTIGAGSRFDPTLSTATVVQTAGVIQLLGGTFNAGTLNLQGGLLTGFGTVDASVINAARIEPGIASGDQTGTLTITNGTYAQTATGILAIQLGGTVTTAYDRLVISGISGTATLGGTLEVSLVDGFVPVVGNTFDVMTYASFTGAFAQITGLNVGGGIVLTANVEPTRVRLVAGSA